jgi:hypothetical protein
MAEGETLEAKRAQLDAKLGSLKMAPEAAALVRQADAAVAKYRGEASALERQIAEIDAQLGVREMDRREAAQQQKQQQWLTMRQQLLDEEERRLQAVERAEQATRALVKAIDDLVVSNAKMSTLARELSPDRKVPMPLNPMELVNRMASRIAATMSTIKGHRNRLGGIDWPSGASGLYPASGPAYVAWREDEEQRMARALIGPLLERGKA